MGTLFDIRHDVPQAAAALAKKPAEVLAALDRAVGRGAIELADAEKTAAPKFQSYLANSILAGRVSESPLEYRVIANSEHGIYVDEGTKEGGRPPLDQILKWMAAKGIVAQLRGRNPSAAERDLARLIRLRIAQHGIKAQPFWEETFEAKKDRLAQLARDGVLQALERAA